MLGKQQLTITSTDFLKGASASQYAADGGFSPLSTNVTLSLNPGVVNSTPSPTNASTNVAGTFIASCANNGDNTQTDYLTRRRNFLDSSANFYSLAGTTITKQATGSKTYTYGLSDLVPYGNKYYATTAYAGSNSDVTQWDGASSLNESWWTSTQSQSSLTNNPHPTIVYNDLLWIADGEYLHNYNGSTVATEVIDLGANQVIYALGVDPGTGEMLISSMLGEDASLGLGRPKYVWMYDGASAKPSRYIPTNDLVMSFHSIADIVFVGTSRNIGIWNGSGIQAVHQFLNVTYDSDYLPYKPHLTNVGNILYFTDRKVVFAYGEVQQAANLWMRSPKVFYPFFVPTDSIDHLTLITDLGDGDLGVYYNTTAPANKFVIVDTTSAGSSGEFASNVYEFPRPVIIHRVRVFTTGITNASSVGDVTLIDENDNDYSPTIATMSSPSGTTYRFDFDFQCKLQSLQVILGFGGYAFGLKRMAIFYDVAE